MTEPLNIKDKQLEGKIIKALDSIRPYLEADGGDVKIVELTSSNQLVLEFEGACGSCPMSSMTFKAGIEEAIKRECPEITEVIALNITDPDDPEAILPGNYKK